MATSPASAQEKTQHTSHVAPQRAGCWLPIVAFLGLYQIIFSLRVLQQHGTLGITSSVPPALEAGISLIWGVVFVILVLGLLQRRLWAGRWVSWLIVGFISYKVAYIVLFAQADYDRGRVPFLLVTTSLILIIPLVIAIRDARQLIDSR